MNIYLKTLESTPKTLLNIIDQIKPDRFAEHTEPNRFNLTELVAHLADFEDIFLDRLRLAQEKPGATITPVDPDARAVEKDYSNRDIRHELEVFENRRRDLTDFLNNLTPEEWSRSFIHPELGELTIEQYANIILAHDLSHLSHATSYMR
jgi:uncharacterized damage-inducible protein DinB